MKKEKPLSDKQHLNTDKSYAYTYILTEDVAEAVKKLKGMMGDNQISSWYAKKCFDKIMGNFNQDNRPKVKVPSDKLYDELYGDKPVKKDKGCGEVYKDDKAEWLWTCGSLVNGKLKLCPKCEDKQ